MDSASNASLDSNGEHQNSFGVNHPLLKRMVSISVTIIVTLLLAGIVFVFWFAYTTYTELREHSIGPDPCIVVKIINDPSEIVEKVTVVDKENPDVSLGSIINLAPKSKSGLWFRFPGETEGFIVRAETQGKVCESGIEVYVTHGFGDHEIKAVIQPDRTIQTQLSRKARD